MIDEATGQPVPGGSLFWDAPIGSDNPGCPKSAIQGHLSIVKADSEGLFTLTVPPTGPVRLQVFGPTHQYVSRAQCGQWMRTTVAG